MTLFEYLAAGYVLMLSFAVLRAISGLPHALRPDRGYWIHSSWLLTALLLCVLMFWGFWPFRDVDWTLFRFMNSLACPAFLYAFISLLVPTDPSAVAAWREHFFNVRIPLFATGSLMATAVGLSFHFTMSVSPVHPSQLGTYLFLAIFLAGLVSPRPRVHAVLAAVFPALWVVYTLALLTEPDSQFRPVR
jgi:hypothetical protein